MIRMRQRIVPRSRTHTGSLWEASTEIDGKPYSAASRHGAPQALARALLAAGIPDQPVEVRSEVCVFDNGAEIRTEELCGCRRYRSLHRIAGWTFQEGATAPLRCIRYHERPEGIFPAEEKEPLEGPSALCGGAKKCVSSPADVSVEESDPDVPKNGLRKCVSCGADFLPTRPWSRLRAHRGEFAPPAGDVPRAVPTVTAR
jgi:hypothetical protein